MLKIDIAKFSKWIIGYGGEILPVTNEYEAVRFKGKAVGVLYKSGRWSGEYAKTTLDEFRGSKAWSGRPHRVGRKPSYKKQKARLLERDGDRCFYCGHLLGDDVTVEHLISLTSGGKNSLGNMVLAHEFCNHEAGNMTVVQKVRLAMRRRFFKDEDHSKP